MYTILFYVYQLIYHTKCILLVQKGTIVKTAGAVSRNFLYECREVIRLHQVQTGIIYVTKNSNGESVLKCSSSIPQSVAQALRNVWSFTK